MLPSLLLAAALAADAGRAAETVPYDVAITPTGEAAIDSVVTQTSVLVSLRETPVSPFALILRARDDLARFQTAMNSEGHYAGATAITIDGHALDDPNLPDFLESLPAGHTAKIAVTMTPGPVFTLRRVTVNGGPPPPALALAPGSPARAADVLAAQERLRAALLADGYALAAVNPPVATLAPADKALDVDFTVKTGPRVEIGEITFAGLGRVEEDYARLRLGLHPGEQFSPARLAQAKQELMGSGTFASVIVEPATELDATGRLPVRVRVNERPLRAVDVGAAWSTDQGGSVSFSWTHRNLFGRAEQLTLSAAATQIGGTASAQPGYNLGAALTFPDWLQRDQKLTINVSAFREYLRAYDRTGATAGATVTRPIATNLTASVGLQFTQEQVIQEGDTNDYSLIQFPLGLKYDSTDSLLDPHHGLRGALTLTPTFSFGGRRQSNFLIAQAAGSAYFDLLGDGRTILATRALIGEISGAPAFGVPPDQRFYGGGSPTVRGFRYQGIGPQFASNRPVGGTAIDAATLELRQRFLESWGAAFFVDAGQVSAEGGPFSGKLNVGVGAGVRYYTSIGPVRVDFAVPVVKGQRKGDAFEMYIGLGHAF